MMDLHFLLLTGCFLMGEQPKTPGTSPLDTNYLQLHAETRGFMLGRPVKPRPTPDGQSVLFLRCPPRLSRLSLYEFSVATGKTRELVTPGQVLPGTEENLTPEEKARRERQRMSLGGFTEYQISPEGNQVLLTLSGKLYLFQRDPARVKPLQIAAGTVLDPQFSPGGKSISFVRDFDLHLLDLETGKERPITFGGTASKTHGLAEFVAQEEMHRHGGSWWSPDGEYIAFEEADATGVEVWHVADPMHPEQKPLPSYYPRPGRANVSVRLGILPINRPALQNSDPIWVQWDNRKYPYLGDVRWPKTGPMTILVQNRTQTEQVLLQVDPASGKTTPLVTEQDTAWLNLHHDTPRWLEDGSFLWSAERHDGTQLEWREKNGMLRKVVVPPESGYQELLDVDLKAGQILYRASTDPTQVHLHRLFLGGGKAVQLTRLAGVYTASLGKQSEIYVQTAGTRNAMPRTSVHRADGTEIGVIPSVAEEPDFAIRDEFVVVGKDRGFHAVLTRPHNFQASSHYPVLLHVYGGPTSQMVTQPMNGRLLDQWLADQGFMVVAIDNRGTPGRGREWHRAVSKHLGTVPLEDQVAGLRFLGERYPELDLKRVGIYGWSFGGYLSALAVLRRPDVFQAGMAGAPVVDWLDYDTHYTERYLGLPDSDAAAYREASLLTYAADLKKPLLLVHGTADDNVYFRHSLKLADALFKAGKEFDMLPLSGLTHMVPDPVVMRSLWSRTRDFFHKHLGHPN